MILVVERTNTCGGGGRGSEEQRQYSNDSRRQSMQTYTSKGVTTVTTLGGRHELLDVVDHKLAAGGLHHTPPVGGGVVGLALAEGDTLSHLEIVSTASRRGIEGNNLMRVRPQVKLCSG